MTVSSGANGDGAAAGTNPEQEVEKPLSLREVAEQSWNEIEADADADEDLGAETAARDDGRDERGRFAKKVTEELTGEQTEGDKQPEVPAQQKPQEPTQPTDPAQQGNQPPAHWSEQDRKDFAELPKKGQEFLLRRYGEMERDYTQKTQANATAVQFTQALAPVFTHPQVQQSLVDYQTGNAVHPVEAIRQWADMHVRAMSPDPNVRAGFARDIMQRLKLDPAAVFGLSPSSENGGLSQEDLKDPAVKFFADKLSEALGGVTALRGELDTIKTQTTTRQREESLRFAQQGVDAFADATDERGQKLYPYFDEVIPELMQLYQANPDRDMREAYNTAIWMSATVRAKMQASTAQATQQRQDHARAAAAARSNIRGRTTPVAKGDQNPNPKGLRATINAAADEVGYEG